MKGEQFTCKFRVCVATRRFSGPPADLAPGGECRVDEVLLMRGPINAPAFVSSVEIHDRNARTSDSLALMKGARILLTWHWVSAEASRVVVKSFLEGDLSSRADHEYVMLTQHHDIRLKSCDQFNENSGDGIQ